jgi:hypothetical protein
VPLFIQTDNVVVTIKGQLDTRRWVGGVGRLQPEAAVGGAHLQQRFG